jgi:hypothetical protein
MSKLEGLHVIAQMELRQRQLDDVTRALRMYTDTETMKRLGMPSAEQQQEELAEYRSLHTMRTLRCELLNAGSNSRKRSRQG